MENQKTSDRPKAMVEDAEQGGRGEQHRSHTARRRQLGEQEADQQAADRRGRAHEAEPFRADVKDVLGEHRQQAHDPAEQDREEIECNRAEQDLLVPDEAKATEYGLEINRLGGAVGFGQSDLHRGKRRHRKKEGDEQIDPEAEQRDQNAAQCRTEHESSLENRGRRGDRGRELVARDNVGEKRVCGRLKERARGPVDDQDQKDRPGCNMTRQRVDQEQAAEDGVDQSW